MGLLRTDQAPMEGYFAGAAEQPIATGSTA
jgi:hypothetical protein